MMKILGIDLSLNSPAVCFFSGEQFNQEECIYFYFTNNKKLAITNKKFSGTLIPEYYNDMQRYENITRWVMNIISDHTPDHIFIEGYSFSSTGKVFNIAENCGILKYNIWKYGITYSVLPPSVVKKNATGKGNANKQLMEETFLLTTGLDVRKQLKLSASVSNPVSDIIDSYFIAKAGLEYVKEK